MISIFNSVQINEAPIFSADDPDGPPIAQYDYQIDSSELCKPNLNDMPVEILLPILKDIDTLHTLWGVISASKRLYAVFQHYAVEIVDAILEQGPTSREISNRMRAIFLVRFILPNAAAAPDVIASGSPTDENDMMLQWPAFSDIPAPVQPADLCKLVRLAYQIHGLAHCCLETSLAKCKTLLARPAHEFDLLEIPSEMAYAADIHNSNLHRRNIMWSFGAEETTILSIWRLQYFYQIKDAISKADGGDSGDLASLFSSPSQPFESLPKFFHSHVREQILTVFAILNGLHHIPHAMHKPEKADLSERGLKTNRSHKKTPKIRGPIGGVRRTQALEWLYGLRDSDEEPLDEDNERQLNFEFAWSRTDGPWKLPELRHVTRPKNDNPSWPRCAIIPTPAARLQALIGRPGWLRAFHPSNQEDHVFGMAIDQSLNSDGVSDEADDSSSSPRSNKPPAWTFLKTIKRPDMSPYTNRTELMFPIRPYRELGVFLLNEESLIELGLWPIGGLREEHTQKQVGTVGEIDNYTWQWIKLLSRVKQSELISEEEMAAWRVMGHPGRRLVLLCLDIPLWVRREFEYIDGQTENWIIQNFPQYLRVPDYGLPNHLGY